MLCLHLFIQIFGDSKQFQKDEVKNVQECCVNMILEHIEASTNNDMKDGAIMCWILAIL